MISFSSLILERQIFEIRYETAFLYWDNTGKLAADLVKRFPKFKLKDINLSNSQLEWADESVVLNFSSVKADVTQEFPEKSEPFRDICGEISALVVKHFELSSFARAGVRLQFVLPAKDEAGARDLVRASQLVSVDEKSLVAFGEEIMEEQVMLRVEDENRGTILRTANLKREFTVTLPRTFPVDTKRFHPHVLLLDLDSYTKKLVATDVFKAPDFIRRAEKTAEGNLLTLARLG